MAGGARAREGRISREGDKRDRILAAAGRVFAEKGFPGATVAEIARAAGVADGTIYLYFRSKDDVFVSWVEEAMGRVIASARERIAAAPTGLAQLRAFILHHFEQVAARPDLAEVLTVELRPSSKRVKAYRGHALAAYLDLLAGVLETGKRDGSVRAGLDVKAVRRAIFGALDEVALSWLVGRRRFDLGRDAEELAELFARGIAATEETTHARAP